MRTKTLLFMLLSAFVVLSMGCSQQPSETNTAEASLTEDGQLVEAVESRIAADQDLASREIDVEADNGVVTLRGTVASEAEAHRAAELAKGTEGVRSVYSYLKADVEESAEGSGLDDKLKEGAEEVGDKAEDLAEEVGDKAEDVAETIGEGVKEAGKEGKDAAITAQIKLKLSKDDVVDADDIDVDTQNGRVTLSGTVANKDEEERAIQIARSVDQVLSVQSRLTVTPEGGGSF